MQEWLNLAESELLSQGGVPDPRQVQVLSSDLLAHAPVAERANVLFYEAVNTIPLGDEDDQRRIHAGLEKKWRDMEAELEAYRDIQEDAAGEKEKRPRKEEVNDILQDAEDKLETVRSCLEEPASVRSEEDALRQLQKHAEMQKTLGKIEASLGDVLKDDRQDAEATERAARLLSQCRSSSGAAAARSAQLNSALSEMGRWRMAVRERERELEMLSEAAGEIDAKSKQGPEAMRSARQQIPVRIFFWLRTWPFSHFNVFTWLSRRSKQPSPNISTIPRTSLTS